MDEKQIKNQTSRRVAYDDAQVEALFERLRTFLRRNLRKVLKDLERGDPTAREAVRMLGGLESALKDAGLSERLQPIRDLFAAEYDAVQAEFLVTTGKAAILSNFTRRNLDAIVDDRLRMAGKVVEAYVGDVRTAALDSIVAGRRIDADDVLEGAEGATLRNIQTEIRTTLIAYNRVVHQEKARKAGITKFLYVGPDDEVTRPFCRERVGRVFTQAEIDAWDNDQGLPANIYCGGYNCRHHLRPLSDDFAEELASSARLREDYRP